MPRSFLSNVRLGADQAIIAESVTTWAAVAVSHLLRSSLPVLGRLCRSSRR